MYDVDNSFFVSFPFTFFAFKIIVYILLFKDDLMIFEYVHLCVKMQLLCFKKTKKEPKQRCGYGST